MAPLLSLRRITYGAGTDKVVLETLQAENAHSTEATCARRFLFNRQFYQGVKV
jgi:hypothetical protein